MGDHAQTGRNSRENKGRGMIRVGENERNWEGKFANRLQEQIRGDLLGKCARRKQERWREGGREAAREGGVGVGENLCLCGQTTQKLERHKLIKMHSTPPRLPLSFSPFCFFPSSSLSHFISLHHFAPFLSCRRWRVMAL